MVFAKIKNYSIQIEKLRLKFNINKEQVILIEI